MKPEFLTSPAAWTRAPRTGQSTVDAACAVELTRKQHMDWEDRLVLRASVLAAIALAIILLVE